MDQVVMPDIAKQNERLNSVEGQLHNCIESVEKMVVDQARMQKQFFMKGKDGVQPSAGLALKEDLRGSRGKASHANQMVVFN